MVLPIFPGNAIFFWVASCFEKAVTLRNVYSCQREFIGEQSGYLVPTYLFANYFWVSIQQCSLCYFLHIMLSSQRDHYIPYSSPCALPPFPPLSRKNSLFPSQIELAASQCEPVFSLIFFFLCRKLLVRDYYPFIIFNGHLPKHRTTPSLLAPPAHRSLRLPLPLQLQRHQLPLLQPLHM